MPDKEQTEERPTHCCNPECGNPLPCVPTTGSIGDNKVYWCCLACMIYHGWLMDPSKSFHSGWIRAWQKAGFDTCGAKVANVEPPEPAPVMSAVKRSILRRLWLWLLGGNACRTSN